MIAGDDARGSKAGQTPDANQLPIERYPYCLVTATAVGAARSEIEGQHIRPTGDEAADFLPNNARRALQKGCVAERQSREGRRLEIGLIRASNPIAGAGNIRAERTECPAYARLGVKVLLGFIRAFASATLLRLIGIAVTALCERVQNCSGLRSQRKKASFLSPDKLG